ncbi:Uma2 family endonuclease [Nostoc spongiaeforme FACHB-130]|uniref:Uma2 family endonuclease n=1 Tax=Nostoc spongiaeforme FACHB-130 TaxID=1357510 RepID=A0ABR8G3F2_9NOSO|nr:Uma2 family endonuclease [Nostoc spongiaeforme]MBD2597768.1 Uma2 family endonuclease [Nostoc spongiaeforme FACHB-130]
MQILEPQYFTIPEYLNLEDKADFKSEYIDGIIIPMAGGTANHNRISGNFYAILNFAFRQQDYEVFNSDMRLWIPKQRIYTYLDISIVAGKIEFLENRTDTITNPKLIVEVLSKSTESYDREGKFKVYRTIPSFEEYLLVEQDRIFVEHFYKTANKRWSLQEYDAEDELINLVTVPLEIKLQDLYNKVEFEVKSDVEQ